MEVSQSGEITRLLIAWRHGDQEAGDKLAPLVYDELYKMARGYLGAERPNHTLQPTALVNEAYLRLVEQKQVEWHDRSHFFAIASRMIHRILVDHARRYRYAKRGGGQANLPLSEVSDLAIERPEELVALDEALKGLEARDPLKAKIVEYRFFGGMTASEISVVVGCSSATISRHWSVARAWLFRQMSRSASGEGGGRDHPGG